MSERTIITDESAMRQAIGLAMLGRGSAEPNPLVGCVIVRDGEILGRGYHERFGGPHAEPNALANCQSPPAGATAYITLEPCCHLEKKTPPCVPKLIEAGLKRVVVGCLDPNPMVNGRGMEQLRVAGIATDDGILGSECRQLNAPFFKRMDHRRPYVTLKWAQTADGKIAGPGGQRVFITNPKSLAVLHQFRSRCDAIMVGINTVLADDPLLTSRGVKSNRPLLRIVLDRELRIPLTNQLVTTTSHGPVLVYCSEATYHQRHAVVAALNSRGVEVAPLSEASGKLSLTHLLDDLGGRSVTHLLVESGPKLAASFFGEGLADRVWIFRSPRRIDDPTAPDAPATSYPVAAETTLDDDRLTEYLNPQSPVFFSLTPSSDFAAAKRG